MFLFLSDIHFHSPPRAKPRVVVDMYVNGHGTLIYATVQNDPTSQDSKVHNTRMHLSSAQVRTMAQGRCESWSRAHIRIYFDEVWKDDAIDRTLVISWVICAGSI
jgi:hypothetical protein